MKQAFKDAYERELTLLKQRAASFAEEHPGLADRLGGLMEENLDPSIQGLLEGSAFLAARVQLNIDQQFRTFSTELLEQLCPEMTAPLPSAMMVQGTVPGKPEDLAQGRVIQAGAYVEAEFREGTRRVPCRYRLAQPLTVWPVEIGGAEYHGSPTPLSALGCDSPELQRAGEARTEAGLVVTLATTHGLPVGDLLCDRLPITFTGALRNAQALYEQVFANRVRVSLRWEDELGSPVFRRLPPDAIAQVGFDPDYPLFGRDERLFPGISLLLEYFSYPRKFLGLELRGLRTHLQGIPTEKVQLVFEFSRADQGLATRFEPGDLALFCAPAVNIFEEEAKPITLDNKHHRFLVAPNRTPATHFEVLRVRRARAHYEGLREKVRIDPLYALPPQGTAPRKALYYGLERQRRALSPQERRLGGTRYRYEGTETWITLFEPPEEEPASLAYVTVECSNRHLPEILPIMEGTFHLIEDRMVTFKPVTQPSVPRDAAAELETDAPHRMSAGDNYWRLISLLALSQRGMLGPRGEGNVAALHETLRLFSDISDQLTEAQITAISRLKAKPVTRTIERPDGFHPARGVELTVVFDDEKMESAAMVCLGAVLDHYFADAAQVNTFTQTVVENEKGRRIKRFAPRGGAGPLL
ncbi:MAG: type VI secretion system baseplate subunit TssF [Pseudomonadota bacterium]